MIILPILAISLTHFSSKGWEKGVKWLKVSSPGASPYLQCLLGPPLFLPTFEWVVLAQFQHKSAAIEKHLLCLQTYTIIYCTYKCTGRMREIMANFSGVIWLRWFSPPCTYYWGQVYWHNASLVAILLSCYCILNDKVNWHVWVADPILVSLTKSDFLIKQARTNACKTTCTEGQSRLIKCGWQSSTFHGHKVH